MLNGLKTDAAKMSALNEFISSTNRLFSAVYFELNASANCIECYGHKNVVATKLDEIVRKFPQLRIDADGRSKPKQSNEKPPSAPSPPPPLILPQSFSTTNNGLIEIDSNGLIGFCLSKSPQLVNDFK